MTSSIKCMGCTPSSRRRRDPIRIAAMATSSTQWWPGGSPVGCGVSAIRMVDRSEVHRHATQFFVDQAAPAQGPPTVKISLHGLPHGYPAAYEQALPEYFHQCTVLFRNQLAQQ